MGLDSTGSVAANRSIFAVDGEEVTRITRGYCRFWSVGVPAPDPGPLAATRLMSERHSVHRQNARWRIVDGETVVINLTTTHYYSLNRTGTYVWNLLLEGGQSVDDLAGAVAARYGQPLDVVRRDVRALIDDLRREDLIVATEADLEDRAEKA
jgi:hypothetical protein